METPLLIAIVAASATVVGTVVGTLASFFTNRHATKEKFRREDRLLRYQERESLYSDFLGEAMKVAVLAVKHNPIGVDEVEITRLVTLEARIWLHSAQVGAAATNVAKKVTKLAFPAQATPVDKDVDPYSFAVLRDRYVDVCAKELTTLRNEA